MENQVGSAGAPILNVLLKQNLSNVLVVVTRYFGGTLLGVGGLVNTYTSVTTKALEKVEYIEKKKGYEVNIKIKKEKYNIFKKHIEKNKINILETKYLNDIEIFIKIEIDKNKLEEIKKFQNENNILGIIEIKILKEKYI